ncbi:hypothetical protein ACH4D5_24410 [Streptomyces sp. NPDC018029]|uniref:hypothetical protein n=1 Tax=Streptomyces sp. NPDC018029 TaxID=3365032 RepID=UPI00378BC489
MSGNGLLVNAMAWGAIIIELMIASLLVGPERRRKLAFRLDVLLRGAIIATIGLWSFSLIMISPARSPRRRTRVELMNPEEHTRCVPRKAGDADEAESRQRTDTEQIPTPHPHIG